MGKAFFQYSAFNPQMKDLAQEKRYEDMVHMVSGKVFIRSSYFTKYIVSYLIGGRHD